MKRIAIPSSLKRLGVILLVLALVAVVAGLTASFWINWWWFGSMGYRHSLVARYRAEIVYTILGGLAFAAFFGINLALALRRTRESSPRGSATQVANRLLVALLAIGTGIVAVLFGRIIGQQWETWQLARFVSNYGEKDPVFNRDISFYLLRLPAMSNLLDLLLGLAILTLICTALVYIIRLGIRIRRLGEAPNQMRVHLLALAGLIVLMVGVRYVFMNYQLVYSTRGAVFGAGYTDVNVQRWINYFLVFISLIVGGLLLVNAFMQRIRPLLLALAAWAVASLLIGVFLPSIIQQVFVEPSELSRERPFISNNMAMTREGFDLTDVTMRELSGMEPLEASALDQYPETLGNIRLWDYRIARTAFQQLESFVPYYVFLDVDIDRYVQDGSIDQVLISARELVIDGLPSGSQTWVNSHLVYTHGYGAVAGPVSEATAQGLPVFVVQSIPPDGEGVFAITQPEIYFGESQHAWVAVHSNQPEFSGEISFQPGEDTGFAYSGEGRGSIGVGGFIGKTLLAIHLRDQNVFFTDQFNDDTRVLLRQQINDRILEIAPFLELDDDPYLVINDGRLFWVVDAYTTSDLFPHATRYGGINYIRNSVKVVVDAYNGNVDFYRTSTVDPVADAYDQAYGDLFKPIGDMPTGLSEHFRYPERMYEIQSEAFTRYHVSDPTAFYNGEDLWAVPDEYITNEDQPTRMVPYYVTLTLPGENDPSYALIRPYVPGGNSERQNMTAWMAGLADETGSNSLVLYRFPRQETVFGPSQISARIDQEPEISAQISLWNQSGSQVIRGNLLVIPVGDSVLYVQPLYLQARNQSGALPELRRVIVASNERTVMRPTLAEALLALTGGSTPVDEQDVNPASPSDSDVESPATSTGTTATDATLESLALAASDAFERGQAAMEAGDWEGFGEAQAELQEILEMMSALASGAPEATPAAAGTPQAQT
ncbi:MAG: UPF0182 family protein [Thermomicrobiales bacterium]|nr:UPF0182 family protein [Thermomicrobiales bacterium]